MISFMLEQTINTKIPAALPRGVPVAHKTGELPDASHDVGYLLIPHSQVAVGVRHLRPGGHRRRDGTPVGPRGVRLHRALGRHRLRPSDPSKVTTGHITCDALGTLAPAKSGNRPVSGATEGDVRVGA